MWLWIDGTADRPGKLSEANERLLAILAEAAPGRGRGQQRQVLEYLLDDVGRSDQRPGVRRRNPEDVT